MTKGRITPRWYVWRSILVVGVHLLAFMAAYLLAFALKFEFSPSSPKKPLPWV